MPTYSVPENIGKNDMTIFELDNTTTRVTIINTSWNFSVNNGMSLSWTTYSRDEEGNWVEDSGVDLNNSNSLGVKFSVTGEAEYPKIVNIDMTTENDIGSDTNQIDTETKSAKLYMAGDTNLDGILDIIDVIVLIGMLIDNIDPETNPTGYYVSDIMNDGLVNVVDVVVMIEEILEPTNG